VVRDGLEWAVHGKQEVAGVGERRRWCSHLWVIGGQASEWNEKRGS
jgi:hypothetical protein